jgi:hypothetical protein
VSGEPKETAVSREIMPADGLNPADRDERGFRHVPAYRRATLRRVDTAYLAPTGVAKSKDCCRLSNAATSLPRFTMLHAPQQADEMCHDLGVCRVFNSGERPRSPASEGLASMLNFGALDTLS